MSGTSMDAIDASLVRFDVNKCNVIQSQQTPIPKHLKQKLQSVHSKTELATIAALDTDMGVLFADAALQIIKTNQLSYKEIHAIGSHGQTVLHLPIESNLYTVQIGDPNIIACQTNITTVADFRRMDIAAGGQGAPLATAFHQWLFQQQGRNRVVLNLGGIANITIIASDETSQTIGFDTGPSNTLMDAWAQKHLHQAYDKGGEWAKSGQYNQQLLSQLLNEQYFSAKPPKSTGKDLFNLPWLDKKLSLLPITMPEKDVQATLLELSAITIRDAIQAYAPTCNEILVCGGGVQNQAMMERLAQLNPLATIKTTQEYGYDPDAIESITFAWLAKRRLEEKTSNLISATGADRQLLLGAIYKAGNH